MPGIIVLLACWYGSGLVSSYRQYVLALWSAIRGPPVDLWSCTGAVAKLPKQLLFENTPAQNRPAAALLYERPVGRRYVGRHRWIFPPGDRVSFCPCEGGRLIQMGHAGLTMGVAFCLLFLFLDMQVLTT